MIKLFWTDAGTGRGSVPEFSDLTLMLTGGREHVGKMQLGTSVVGSHTKSETNPESGCKTPKRLQWMFHCLPSSASSVPQGPCFLSSFPFCVEIGRFQRDAHAGWFVLISCWPPWHNLLADVLLAGCAHAWSLPHHRVTACRCRSAIPDGDLRESGPRPLGLDATKKKMVKENIWKSVSYLLSCQVAVKTCWNHNPRKMSVERIFLPILLAVGETLPPAAGWDRWGQGQGRAFCLLVRVRKTLADVPSFSSTLSEWEVY